jgi:hypothetical protein
MFQYKAFDSFQLVCSVTEARSDRDGMQPEFRREIFTIHMHVGRFAWFMAVKVHPERAAAQNGRHPSSLPRSGVRPPRGTERRYRTSPTRMICGVVVRTTAQRPAARLPQILLTWTLMTSDARAL